MVEVLLLGYLFANTGWGPWFPWSIVLLSANTPGPVIPGFGPTLVLLGVSVLCAVGAFLSLDRTDNTQ